MNQRRWTLVIAAAMTAAVIGLFFTCFERRSEWEYRGASPEAVRNPYLALERLLERLGHDVRVLAGPSELEGPLPVVGTGTIFYPANRLTLGEERSRRLLRWVEAGGHLWVVTWTIWDDEHRRPDFLLDELGIRQLMHDEPVPEALARLAQDAVEEDPTAADEEEETIQVPLALERTWPAVTWDAIDVRFEGESRRYRVHFDQNFYLDTEELEPAASVSGPGGVHLVRLDHGRGRITVSTDDYLVRNDALAEADHAEVVLRILRRGEAPGPVWLLPVERWPGLWELVRRHAWAPLLAGACWLLAWVWRASRRFGPLIPERPPVRRSLLEHVEAAGRLLARGRRDVLVEAARESLHDVLRERRPAWLRLAPVELDARLAAAARLEPVDVALALRGEAPASGRGDFTRTIATLERIRHAL